MELGERLRQARIDAGFSQRQLCGEEITRNMLSQIEHGTAKPSMGTLQYLAARLGKPVSYFLEEEAVLSPNQSVITSARRLYDAGDYAGAALVLEAYQAPDETYDRERQILEILTLLALAEQMIEEGRLPYARELLEKADQTPVYCSQELHRKRLLLLGRLRGQRVCHLLPSLDEELLLRAEESLAAGDAERAAQLLEAAQDKTSSRWCFLRGETCMAQGHYKEAAMFFHGAEGAYPQETAARLETCYREMEDYKRAYEYARKQK